MNSQGLPLAVFVKALVYFCESIRIIGAVPKLRERDFSFHTTFVYTVINVRKLKLKDWLCIYSSCIDYLYVFPTFRMINGIEFLGLK